MKGARAPSRGGEIRNTVADLSQPIAFQDGVSVSLATRDMEWVDSGG